MITYTQVIFAAVQRACLHWSIPSRCFPPYQPSLHFIWDVNKQFVWRTGRGIFTLRNITPLIVALTSLLHHSYFTDALNSALDITKTITISQKLTKSTSTWPVQMINVVLFFLRQTTHSISLSGRTFLYDSPVFARNFISIDSRTGSVIHTFGAVAPRSQSLSLLGCYVTHPRT